MRILGVHYSHDAGAAIIEDGKILAAVNEERYTREKLYWGFPKNSLREVFNICKIKPSQIDYVAFANITPGGGPQKSFGEANIRKKVNDFISNSFPFIVGSNSYALFYRNLYSKFRMGKSILNYLKKIGVEAPVSYIDHHLCHAASAFYTSGFDKDTLVVTTDGTGDGLCSTVSIIDNDYNLNKVAFTPSFHSPATVYAYVTYNLGFSPNKHEGKITGLAAYGKPQRTYSIFKSILDVNNTNYKVNKIGYGRLGAKHLHMLMQNKRWEDIAAGLQKRFEEVCSKLIENALKKYPRKYIALAGGAYANVKLNQRIAELNNIKKVFIHPHMGDGGLAVGAALSLWSDLLIAKGDKPKPVEIDNVYFGNLYNDDQIESVLNKNKIKYKYVKNIEQEIAENLKQKKIVGRFHGRMEYGPRALGSRSILADPTDKTINDWLNKRLHRCYDEKTEILTKEGWKFFEDLKKNEIVATLNPKTNELKYKKVQHRMKYTYNGKLINFKNKRIDILVTPNHKLWVKKRRSNKFDFEYAENLFHKRHIQTKGGVIWRGNTKNKFILPGIKLNKNSKPKLEIDMNLWLEFLGYWIAEGSLHYDKKGHYIIGVAQSKKSRYYKDIETCLKKLPFNVLYDIKEFKIYNKQLYEYLKPLKGARNKFILREFLELSKKQLGILFTALNKGDGNIRGKQYRYATTSKKLSDNVQEIALKLGYSSYISTQKSKNKKHADLYLVRIGKSTISYVRDKQSSKVDYNGYVYCITVPNHIIFVRRNGKAVFCGNSEFMPFAPVIMKEHTKDFYKNFDVGEIAAKFMTITFDVKDDAVKKAPAVVHVDNTARPQTITKEQNESYYKILKIYNELTGLPTVVNTSFNAHEEPIICSPEDAVRSYLRGNVDVLAIGNFICKK